MISWYIWITLSSYSAVLFFARQTLGFNFLYSDAISFCFFVRNVNKNIIYKKFRKAIERTQYLKKNIWISNKIWSFSGIQKQIIKTPVKDSRTSENEWGVWKRETKIMTISSFLYERNMYVYCRTANRIFYLWVLERLLQYIRLKKINSWPN
jgi:hypothetical protein